LATRKAIATPHAITDGLILPVCLNQGWQCENPFDTHTVPVDGESVGEPHDHNPIYRDANGVDRFYQPVNSLGKLEQEKVFVLP
jgi:hypothetical protein